MGNTLEYTLMNSGGDTPPCILVEGKMEIFTQYPNSLIDSKPKPAEEDDVCNAPPMSIIGVSSVMACVDDAAHVTLKSHARVTTNSQAKVIQRHTDLPNEGERSSLPRVKYQLRGRQIYLSSPESSLRFCMGIPWV